MTKHNLNWDWAGSCTLPAPRFYNNTELEFFVGVELREKHVCFRFPHVQTQGAADRDWTTFERNPLRSSLGWGALKPFELLNNMWLTFELTYAIKTSRALFENSNWHFSNATLLFVISLRALERAWRCFRYKDIDHIMECEHECTSLRLPRIMASTVIFP
jgi:hypothetical protein